MAATIVNSNSMRIGARCPRGILLTGPSGTGKSYTCYGPEGAVGGVIDAATTPRKHSSAARWAGSPEAGLIPRAAAQLFGAIERARHGRFLLDGRARLLQRLLQYPAVRGDCVGAFGECSRDLHSLLHDTVRSAAERHWREAGATSARAAVRGSREGWARAFLMTTDES